MPTADPCTTVTHVFAFGDRNTGERGLCLALRCACGERIVISSELTAFGMGLAVGVGGILVNADEAACCGKCGRYLFPLWNAAVASLRADDADQDDAGDVDAEDPKP